MLKSMRFFLFLGGDNECVDLAARRILPLLGRGYRAGDLWTKWVGGTKMRKIKKTRIGKIFPY